MYTEVAEMPVVPELKRRASGEGANVERHLGKTWRKSAKSKGGWADRSCGHGAQHAAPRHQQVLSALGDEFHGFGGEAVEGGDAEFEVLFFCVLDFVVADAAKGLDEHHYGGDSGA
jgi:hypothetical protein